MVFNITEEKTSIFLHNVLLKENTPKSESALD